MSGNRKLTSLVTWWPDVTAVLNWIQGFLN